MRTPIDNFKARFNKVISMRNIKPTELAKKTGLSKSTISHYMSGYTKPKSDKLFVLAKALDVREQWLMGLDVPMERVSDKNTDIDLTGTDASSQILFALGQLLEEGTVTIENTQTGERKKLSIDNGEWALLKDYNSLNKEGQTKANEQVSLLTKIPEYQALDIPQANMLSNIIEFEPIRETRRSTYTYYQRLASAGTGEYIFDDIPTDTIEAPYMEYADFIIGVNGDSMEPTYYDGDKVYVEKRQVIEIGEIGIFMVNRECFIKEAGSDGLISHNKKYHMIPGSEHIICVGKVLGRVEE